MAAVFKFKADGSQYTRGLNQMRGQTQQFSASVGSMLKGAFAFAGIAGLRRLGDEMDRIQKLSKRFGLDAGVIQRLGFAAEQGGSSLEIMAKGLAQANRAAQEAMKGLMTYKRAFEDLEISYTDFSKLDQEQQFMVIADAVKNTTDSNKAMAASQVILGRAGLEMYAQLKDGAQGYRDVVEDLDTYTQEQVDAAAKANDAVNKFSKGAKVLFVGISAFIINSVKGIRAALGQIALETGGIAYKIGRVWKAALTGRGLTQAFDELKSFLDDMKNIDPIKLKLAFDEGVYGQELEDMLSERAAKGIRDGVSTVMDINTGLITAGTTTEEEDQKLDGKRDQVASQRKSNLLFGETDEENLTRIQDEMTRGLEEYNAMAADPSTDKKDLLEKELELLKLQNEELQLIDKAQKEAADKKSADKDKQDAFKKDASDTREQIENERKAREEMGMSDEELLARRKTELAEKEDAFAGLGKDANKDGKIDAEDDVFRNDAELDIEGLKSEIKGLELGLADKADPQTGVITSSLAQIGGGGGVASFGNDPLLSENKRQTNVLEEISSKLDISSLTPSGGLDIPEL